MANKVVKIKDDIMNVLDVNNDGVVDIQDIIISALRTPGIKVDRSEFLRNELQQKYGEEATNLAIAKTPLAAGIDCDEIDEIAEQVINYERNCVSGISAALGMPGGVAMAATIPADIIQYYGYTLRAVQKLLYLYGFPEIDIKNGNVCIDSATINQITLCLGIMNGVAGANNAIKAMAHGLAKGAQKAIMNKALTKGTLYPIAKSVAKAFGVKLTKTAAADAVKNAIPVVGGILGGGITFFTFKPCCIKLKDVLRDTELSNTQHKASKEEKELIDEMVSEATIVDDFEVEEIQE